MLYFGIVYSAYISNMDSYFRLRLLEIWTNKDTAIPITSTTVPSKSWFLLHLLEEHVILVHPLKDHALVDKYSVNVDVKIILTQVMFLLVIVALM